MIIIETFARDREPNHRPTPTRLRMAGLSGFLTLSQSRDGPDR
jgi:hypothetical protein